MLNRKVKWFGQSLHVPFALIEDGDMLNISIQLGYSTAKWQSTVFFYWVAVIRTILLFLIQKLGVLQLSEDTKR